MKNLDSKIEKLIKIRDKMIYTKQFNWEETDLIAEICNFLESNKEKIK